MTSAVASTLWRMFRATVICPDDDCAEAFDAVAELEQLEALMCDCGCTLRVERLSEAEDERVDEAFELVPLG
jgi:hypothetical protein